MALPVCLSGYLLVGDLALRRGEGVECVDGLQRLVGLQEPELVFLEGLHVPQRAQVRLPTPVGLALRRGLLLRHGVEERLHALLDHGDAVRRMDTLTTLTSYHH